MASTSHQINVERRGEVYCIRLRQKRLSEVDLDQLGEELYRLVTQEDCRLMAVALGRDPIDCLHSSFIGKLMIVRKLLQEKGGRLKLCEVGPVSLDALKACKLVELFDIHPDLESTVQALTGTP